MISPKVTLNKKKRKKHENLTEDIKT